MQFEFATASKIIFGAGKLNSIGTLAQEMGSYALIISGAPSHISNRLLDLLSEHGVKSMLYAVDAEPTIAIIRQCIEIARGVSVDLVIGIGGGSAMDTAKATAALSPSQGDVTDYLEVIGLNTPITTPPIPLIAIPTTAGTGSEVTKNAVIEATEHHVKVSLRSPYLFPKLAMVDPELTKSLPPTITAFTGLDALTQLIEPYTCNVPNPLTDALCREGMLRIANSLTIAYENGSDLAARADMSLASLFSGLALANAKLGAVHGLAGAIGGEIAAPHGAICARLLPEVMAVNVKALRYHTPGNPALEKYAEVGKLLTGDPSSTAEDAIQWVRDICTHLDIAPLSSFGMAERQFQTIIDKAFQSSSMKGNPITLSVDELRNILGRSLQSWI